MRVPCLLDSLLQDGLHGVASLVLLHEGNIEGQAKDVIVAHFVSSSSSRREIPHSFSQESHPRFFCQIQRLNSYILEGEAAILWL